MGTQFSKCHLETVDANAGAATDRERADWGEDLAVQSAEWGTGAEWRDFTHLKA